MSDKCVWKPFHGYNGSFLTKLFQSGCDVRWRWVDEVRHGFNFCPYCGKEIEVRDE